MTTSHFLTSYLATPAAALSIFALLLGHKWIALWFGVSALGWWGLARWMRGADRA